MNRVKFGDVVQEIKINVDRTTDDHEFFIAGEHMDSNNIHITRRGRFSESDVGPAFIRLFRPGQVLYGSRRTYLRKVAVADFEGITSNTTFVLETKDSNRLLQGLLPYIMLTDRFSEYAINNSKGSTNPYILFKDLAAYEFDLPTIEEQRQLVVLLSACDRAKEAYKRLIKQTDEVVKSQFIEMFGLPEKNEHGYELACIGDVVCDVHYGTSKKASDDGEYTYLRMNNITYGGELDLSDIKRINVPEKEISGCLVKKGDVLFNRTNSRDLVGKTCAFNLDEPMIIAGYIIRLRMNGRVLPEYLSTFLNLESSKKMLMEMAKGAVGQANINAQEVQSIAIVVPPMEVQLPFLRLIEQSDKSKFVDLATTISELYTCMIKSLSIYGGQCYAE